MFPQVAIPILMFLLMTTLCTSVWSGQYESNFYTDLSLGSSILAIIFLFLFIGITLQHAFQQQARNNREM